MDYANFCTVAAHARKVRTEEAAVALLEVYAEWKCAVYPADVELFTALWGGMPSGWAWTPYTAGVGGFTDVRRASPESSWILTDGRGCPIERPELPPPGATAEDRIAWLRAIHAYNDRVTDIANGAFDVAFRDSMKKGEKTG